jgi:hypothetical protein
MEPSKKIYDITHKPCWMLNMTTWVGLDEPLTRALRRKKPADYGLSMADSKLMTANRTLQKAFNTSYLWI